MFADPVTLMPPGQDQRAIHIKETPHPSTPAWPLGVLYTVGHTQYSRSLSPRQMTENANHFIYSLHLYFQKSFQAGYYDPISRVIKLRLRRVMCKMVKPGRGLGGPDSTLYFSLAYPGFRPTLVKEPANTPGAPYSSPEDLS